MDLPRPKVLIARALRDTYRRERLPPIVLWTLAAAGVRDWARGLDKPLREHVLGRASRSDAAPASGLTPVGPDPEAQKRAARALVSEVMAVMLRRRYDTLRATLLPRLPDASAEPRAVAQVMAALYQLDVAPGARGARWLWDGIGGAPAARERLAGEVKVWPLGATARWHELATHLGELLVAFTQIAPAKLPRAPQVLGAVCFAMGVRYAEGIKRAYGLPSDSRRPEHAIEILRMGEYIFRVNPEHWSGVSADGARAFLEGSACPWYSRPGWGRMHCGIFGQFQSGVCSVFGLDYKLDKTIPKHGGHSCRVTMSPLPVSS